MQNDGKFEINLDHRKLKTPKGAVLRVDSEPLAIVLATEWDSQKETINTSSMHLTSLVTTSQDNPYNLSKPDLVDSILNNLSTDTLLYQSDKDDALYQLQEKDWDPVLQWFNERYSVDLMKNRDIYTTTISDSTRMSLSQHLMSFDESSLHAFAFAVGTLKSVILSCACIDRFLSVEKAVLLARLEEEFQAKNCGRVEWAHDSNQHDLQARLAAAVLLIHFNMHEESVEQSAIT